MEREFLELDIDFFFRKHLHNLEALRIFGYAHDRSLYVNERCVDMRYSQSVCNHSPDGFNWGYHGSGCAQTALAILLEVLPRELAASMHQQFKSDVVSMWEKGHDFDIKINLYKWINDTLKQNNYHKDE